MDYDFCGWATRNDLKCSDGRTIRKDAFKDNDGQKVPLVWNHQHNEAFDVLGHAMLENRDEGVYAYCKFNDTESGKTAKLLVQHGDVDRLSIYANKLKQQGSNVMHGVIREVSLVLAAANPGAYIEDVIVHGEASDEEAVIYTGESIELFHNENGKSEGESKPDSKSSEEKKEDKKMAENEKTVQDVFDEMTEEQKNVVYAMIGMALEENGVDKEDANEMNHSDEGDVNEMKYNVFDNDERNDKDNDNVLSHAEMQTIINDAKRYGSLKESFLAHAQEYGIESIDYLFPDAKSLNTPPEFIKRDMGWVQKVMNGTHHTPFSRIKSVFANITEDEARAKGYTKGKLKKEEVFSLLKRTTTPTTIYKKQKLDRDDVVDITDFDVIAWLKSEMRMMLDEEIARAVLIGDGRLSSSDDKIKEDCIRPIATDAELYTIRSLVSVASNATDDDKAKAFIRAAIKARKEYKGSGEPTLYTTEDIVTDCLLLEDKMGHPMYDSVAKLANVLRVKEIVTVPVMEGAKGPNNKDLIGIIVNLADYNIGADKGGAINMFDDFDIDYNQQKYLIETRCSGALVKPYSAIAFELDVANAG